MSIDARGPRVGAAITTVVLAIVLITGSGWLLFAQTLVFAVGALAGLRYAPYGLAYRWHRRDRFRARCGGGRDGIRRAGFGGRLPQRRL